MLSAWSWGGVRAEPPPAVGRGARRHHEASAADGRPLAADVAIERPASMGVTLEVTMGVHISVGTWGSPDQSMAGQWLPLSKMVSRKIRFSLCEVINRQGVFLWAHKRHAKFHRDPLCFGRPGFQKLITLSHRIKN